MTQSEADEIYNLIKSNQITCDGTRSASIKRYIKLQIKKGVVK